MQAETRTVIVAGAGIAGLSAALALRLAGFSVKLLEREPVLHEIGAGIQLAPNAMRILSAWGVEPQRVCEPEAIELRNAQSGDLLNSLPIGSASHHLYGAPYQTMLRADLQLALLERLKQTGCDVYYGNPVTSIEKYKDRIVVRGHKVQSEGVALIGADGINSKVRSFVPFSPKPTPTHAIAWRALLSPASVSAPFRNAIVIWMGTGAHLVHYPVASGTLINAVLTIDQDWRSAHAEFDPSHLLERLAQWSDAPRAMVETTTDWAPWPIYRLPHSKGGRRRIQLIGDAWHAMPPFLASGAAISIEDAAILSDALLNGTGNAIIDLDAFREKRSARVWRVEKNSSRMGRIYHFPQPFARIRDEVIRKTPASFLLSRNSWLYGERSV